MTALVPDALDANTAGRLTDAQRKGLRAMSRGTRKSELYFAFVSAILGLLVWFAAGPAKYATVKPLIGIALLIIAGTLLVRALLGADSLTEDLRRGRVESVDGAVSRWVTTTHGRNSSSSTYHVRVDKVTAETGYGFYKLVPDAGIVRMFYLPQSHHLVNLEQLADRPLPAGALSDPTIALHDAKQAILGSFFGDQTKQAEARAELAAIGHVMEAPITKGAMPPPAESRDSRPLDEAIVGSWKNVMMAVTFSADGSVAATMPGGRQRTGHWSVDSSGNLVADVMGSEAATQAWVVGDNLTIELGKDAMTFQRAG